MPSLSQVWIQDIIQKVIVVFLSLSSHKLRWFIYGRHMTTCHILHSLSPIILLQFNAMWLMKFHKLVIYFCKILWILCPPQNFFQGNLQATISYNIHSLFQHTYSLTLSSPLCNNVPVKHEATHYTHNFPQSSGTPSLTSQTVLLSTVVLNAFVQSNIC